MSTLDKLKKNSTMKDASILSESKFFDNKDLIHMPVPIMNVMTSARLDGGFMSGLTIWAGPSKHFKTAFTLLMVKAYMDKYPEGIVLFYDNEFGSPPDYFKSFGIDLSRVWHVPIATIEDLKFDLMQQVDNLDREDKVIIAVDSVGNLASKKEVDDALDKKSTADMTRAKQLKSVFRMVTPHLTMKDIPMVVVGHTYKTMEMFSKDVVGGGTGPYYAADSIFIVGRQQNKDSKNVLEGYDFMVRVEKSRIVREGSKVPITVSFEEGMSKWSGLLPLAVEGGFVVKPKKGRYARVDIETGEIEEVTVSEKKTNTKDFWKPIIDHPKFREFITHKYAIAGNEMITDEEVDDAYEQAEGS